MIEEGMSHKEFFSAVSNQLDTMIGFETELFYVDIEGGELFDLYLSSFPEGKDPMNRERSVHNCFTCKKFIDKAGSIVAIVDNELVSIWDIEVDDFYQSIANTLAQQVKHNRIAGVYRNNKKILGGSTVEKTLENGLINIYDHLYYVLPDKFVSNDLGGFRNTTQANKEVLERSLHEFTMEAIETVLDLIEENSLYRGQEHLRTIKLLHEIKIEYDILPKNYQDPFTWVKSTEIRAAGRFKNTVIGTLLSDLSNGVDLETAVNSFEVKVAPTNYKRPKALITQDMIDRAEKAVIDMGIEDSLHRRYANTKDVTSNNLLFNLSSNKKKLKKEKKKKRKSTVFTDLEPTKLDDNYDKAEKIEIYEFVSKYLPHAENVEIMVENTHISNLMSVIAPAKPRSPNIMKWSNPYSWSYNGEVTDSIKERVKRAGGKVDGYMRCSLSWYNYNDLDIHAIEPDGSHIHFANRNSNNGELDVDMNVDNFVLDPVENITWEHESNLQEGKYRFYVHNYTKRETFGNLGFEVEFQLDGKEYLFVYENELKHNDTVNVLEFTYSKTDGMTIIESLPSTGNNKEIWNITTQSWINVSMIMNSPNHWNGERVGNKHWFFILEGCMNPGKARGFYNEFLTNNLIDHRKVFEVLSSKMKTQPSDNQLSGVGFSETQHNRLLCRISGKFDKMFEIVFAPNMTNRFDKSVIMDIEEIGRCEICKRSVTNGDSRLPCPNECKNIFHTSHFLESVRVTGTCPVCRSSVTQIQVNQLVLLETV